MSRWGGSIQCRRRRRPPAAQKPVHPPPIIVVRCPPPSREDFKLLCLPGGRPSLIEPGVIMTGSGLATSLTRQRGQTSGGCT